MEFVELNTEKRPIREKISAAIERVLDHGIYVNGPEVSELENRLAEYTGTGYAVGVSSGTTALLMSLLACDVKPGDPVITTPFSFIATAEVISLLGARPVFADIEIDTFNIDVSKLELKIEEIIKNTGQRPKCVIAVDLFGQAADYDEILLLGEKYGFHVIEDASQSLGGYYRGKRNCSLAHIATTSFYPSKPLGACGNGGMIFTNKKSLYMKLLWIRNHGFDEKDEPALRGTNGTLDTFQAAAILVKLESFHDELAGRADLAGRYTEELKDFVETPFIKSCNVSSWSQYSIRSGLRDRIIEQFRKEGIPWRIYYGKPLSSYKIFSSGLNNGDFPGAEEACRTVLSLPLYPSLGEKDQSRVIEAVINALK